MVVANTSYTVLGADLAMTAVSTGSGYLSAYKSGQAPPPTSTLNTMAGAAVSNLASIATGTNGTFNICSSAGSTNVMANLMGYYTS